MPRLLERGILGASTIILSKDIDKYAFMCGSHFYETDVSNILYNKIKFLPVVTIHNKRNCREKSRKNTGLIFLFLFAFWFVVHCVNV